MKAKLNVRVYATVIAMLAVLITTARCSSNNAANESGTPPVEFPLDAIAGQSGMLEITVPAVSVSVTSVPANAVVCNPTLIQNSAGQGINCAFAAVSNGNATVTVMVTNANGTTTSYTATGSISLPPTPVTQDTFSVAITNPQTQTTATVSTKGSSQVMPSTVMKLVTPVSLQGSVVAPGSIETLNWGDGSSELIAGMVNLTHTYPIPGAYTLTIAAAGGGAAGSLSVNVQVECDSSIPPMVAANPPISASVAGSSDNMYSFTANVTGGSGSFTSLWAPDGTSVYRDPAAVGLSAQYYVDYAKTRNIHVIVTDVSCGNQLPLSMNYDFAIPTSNGTPGQLQGPQVGNVAFIQGLLASSSAGNASDARVGGFMALLQAASDPAPNRLMGNYQVTSGAGPFPSTFSESGFTTINDNRDGIALNATFDASGNMTIQNVTVYVAGNTELGSALYDSYVSSSCTAQGTVTPIMGQNPCTPGNSGTVVLQYTIDFTYNCSSMADSAGNTIALTEGAGYYVVNTSNGTCGGGGQGGGSSPPAF
jgi:hypothetical protein